MKLNVRINRILHEEKINSPITLIEPNELITYVKFLFHNYVLRAFYQSKCLYWNNVKHWDEVSKNVLWCVLWTSANVLHRTRICVEKFLRVFESIVTNRRRESTEAESRLLLPRIYRI